jgi:MSHA biogenesis protein MshG
VGAFSYRGRSARGELVSGRFEADSQDAVAGRLLNLGITPIEIRVARTTEEPLAELWRRLGGGRPTTGDLVLFARQMYTITKSGLPLLRGLRALAHSTHNAVLREALHDVIINLESGRDLTGSLARHGDIFPPLFISIVRVGESTGTLDSAFAQLCEYLALDQDVKDRVKGALRYPLIVIAVIALALGVITVFVIPNFAPVFRLLGNDIPWPTRVIMGVSEFTQHRWWQILLAVGVGLALLRRYVSTEAGRYAFDRWKLQLPIIGALQHQASLSRLSRSLAISLRAGLPMIQTLNIIARACGNEYLAERVLVLRDAVERGESLGQAATAAGMFPPIVLQMIAVGEETGELTLLLEEVAGFYQREVDYRLKGLAAAIEPLLIIGVGAMVLVLALGVFLPLWNMIAHVGAMH